MKYCLIVNLVVICNLSSHPKILLQNLPTHNSRYPTMSALHIYDLINESSINEFQKDSLMKSNNDSEIEFMKMAIEADGDDWQAFQYGMKISKSSFFRTIGDDSNFELARNTERNFRKKKFGLFCFNCNGVFLGLLSLAFSNKELASAFSSFALGGYVLSKIIRMKEINVSYEEAQLLAREYNQKLREESRSPI
ncbi:uncharacterized protein METZ01_LOCUS150326 [marine metagenome]|uniref:Uncharacterized protein n=1 Tax=marine metagenome TaxID=408172 RepID=A0A382A8P7_9ZZZZ